MSMHLELMMARARLLRIARDRFSETLIYLRENGLTYTDASDLAIGGVSVATIYDCGEDRFDFEAKAGEAIEAVVVEALDWDAETCVDLVAWSIDDPRRVLTFAGRCALLGMNAALNPATYCMGSPLMVRRTPLDLFKADFHGAAIVVPHLAARLFLDIPGNIAGADFEHAMQVRNLIDSLFPSGKVMAPNKRAA